MACRPWEKRITGPGRKEFQRTVGHGKKFKARVPWEKINLNRQFGTPGIPGFPGCTGSWDSGNHAILKILGGPRMPAIRGIPGLQGPWDLDIPKVPGPGRKEFQ